jgi:GTP-binding protein YchF
MRLGLVGLPLSGKTTVFNALTGAARPIGMASPSKLELHTAIVDVPEPRLERLAVIFEPRRSVFAQVAYADVAGLDRGVGKHGLSGPFRTELSQMDGFIHIVRTFESEKMPHPEGSVDPQRDLETLDAEFLLADLMLVENRLGRIAEEMQRGKDRATLSKEAELFERLRTALEQETPLRDIALTPAEEHALRGYGFLTRKPVLILVNTGDEPRAAEEFVHSSHQRSALAAIQGRLELELAQLDPEEAALFREEFGVTEPIRERIIRTSYALLGLHTFFTVGDDEVRAWPLPVGGTALDAAASIHTDLARGFVRAEVIAVETLFELGDWNAARQAGKLRQEGRDYVVQDGDVILIRFNI